MAPVCVGADIVYWEPEEITTLRYSINSDWFEFRGNFHALRLSGWCLRFLLHIYYCIAHRLLIDGDDARKFYILMVYNPHTVYTRHIPLIVEKIIGPQGIKKRCDKRVSKTFVRARINLCLWAYPIQYVVLKTIDNIIQYTTGNVSSWHAFAQYCLYLVLGAWVSYLWMLNAFFGLSCSISLDELSEYYYTTFS